MQQNRRLAPHFWLSEFTFSQDATRQGLRNDPPAAAIANLERLALVLEDVRAVLGNVPILISSGYRSPQVNRIVGGSEKPPSAHLTGRAVDFAAPSFGTSRQVCQRIIDAGIVFDQLIDERNWTHLGIALTNAKPRQDVRTAFFQPGAKTEYLPGLV